MRKTRHAQIETWADIRVELDDCLSAAERKEFESWLRDRAGEKFCSDVPLKQLKTMLARLRFYEDRHSRRAAILAGIRHDRDGSHWSDDDERENQQRGLDEQTL